MKRNVVIATLAAAALIGGGTATAIAVSGDDETSAQRSTGVQLNDDRDDRDDDRDDADDVTGKDAADDRDDDGRADDDRDDAGRDDNGRDDDRDDKADDTDDAAGAKAAKLTAVEAIEAALRHTSGTAVAAELDTEHRNLVWDVEILTAGDKWRSVWIDPATGKVLESRDEHEDAEDIAEARAALKGSSVTAVEAARAAAAKGTVTQVDLDGDDRKPTWDVDTTGANGAESEWHVGLDRATVTADRSSDDD